MTSTESRISSENRMESRESSNPERMVEIAKKLDRDFESEINKLSLQFKDPSSEKGFRNYFDWNCKRSYHLLIIIIVIIEFISMIAEIVYLAYNHEKITSKMVLIFALFKGSAILLETISIFHHYCKIIFYMCNFFLFSSIAFGDFGIAYIQIIEGVKGMNNIDTLTLACTWIQFFLAIYLRSKIFCETMIYFLITSLLTIIFEHFDLFQVPDYRLISFFCFIVVSILSIVFIYYICKSKRRDYFFLNKILSELKNKKDLIEYIPMPLFISDPKEIIYLNKPSIDLFNLKEKESSSQNQELKNIILEEKGKNEEISLLDYLKKSDAEESSKNTILKIKNVNKDLEASKLPIKYNEINCWITCFREVSEFIKKTKEELQKKLEINIIGCITHNFRTPLNSILGISNLSLTSSTPLPEEHQQFMHKINQQSLILFNLVDNIHEYFFYKNNKLEREDVLFLPREEINSILNILQDEIEGKNIKISFNIDHQFEEELCNFLNDKKKYRLIIWSSISNSIRYTINGYIKISLRYNEEEKSLITLIEDNGEKRPKETLDYLFQDFSNNQMESQQFNQASVEIGCGISLSKALSQVMGGRHFEITQKEEKGTLFVFDIKNYYDDIPISPSVEGSPSSFLLSPKASSRQLLKKNEDFGDKFINELQKVSSKFKILIVDDVDSNLYVFINYSNKIKLKYDLAHNGLEALQLFEKSIQPEAEYSYKVIFMDINMPIMDGIEATRKIRELENKLIELNSKVSIIGVTANMGSSIKSECISAGMTKFHTKPFSFQDFAQCIELAFF